MEAIEIAEDGVVRFRGNRLVRHLVDSGKVDLNTLLLWALNNDVPAEDTEQFWQMLGYSVSGFGDLDFVRPETVAAADEAAEQVLASRPASISPLEGEE